MSDSPDNSNWLDKPNAFFRTYYRLLSNIATALVALIFLLHETYPPAIEAIAHLAHFNVDELEKALIFVLLIRLMDGQFRIEQKLENPSIEECETEVSAYERLCELVKSQHSIKRVDLIQLSGQTAVSILQQVARSHPRAKVRLLLLHDDVASKFDEDFRGQSTDQVINKVTYDHRARVAATQSFISTLRESVPGFQVETRFYRSYPGVCSVLIDKDIVCTGWYRTYFDGPKVIRIRSHNVPAVVGHRGGAEHLVSFAASHFNELWRDSEENSQDRKKTNRTM